MSELLQKYEWVRKQFKEAFSTCSVKLGVSDYGRVITLFVYFPDLNRTWRWCLEQDPTGKIAVACLNDYRDQADEVTNAIADLKREISPT